MDEAALLQSTMAPGFEDIWDVCRRVLGQADADITECCHFDEELMHLPYFVGSALKVFGMCVDAF